MNDRKGFAFQDLRGRAIDRLLASQRRRVGSQASSGGCYGVCNDAQDQQILFIASGEISPHRILGMEKLASKGLVDDDDLLRIRTIRIAKGSTRQNGNLQGFKISRCYVERAG